MAWLKHLASGTQHILLSRHVVGREARSDLLLDQELVSSLHAELRWSGTCWELRDLGSRNGTFVNRTRLDSGELIALSVGDLVCFGDRDNVFELIDDAEPVAIAIGADGTRISAEHGMLVLPDSERPVYVIFEQRGRWIAELTSGERRPVSNRDMLAIDRDTWTLDLPVVTPRTLQSGNQAVPLRSAVFRFSVSRDEEHVKLDIVHRGKSTHLPHRAYSYMLLTLARARHADRTRGNLAEVDQGWLYSDSLADMLGIDLGHLHQYICRARKALSRAGVLGFADAIERRPGTQQVRLGISDIEITSL